MKLIIIAAFTLFLSACGSNPSVKNSFPDAPEKLMTKPAALQTVLPKEQLAAIKLDDITASGIQLSAVTKVITNNYTTCNLYQEQIFGLQNWILEQKKLNP